MIGTSMRLAPRGRHAEGARDADRDGFGTGHRLRLMPPTSKAVRCQSNWPTGGRRQPTRVPWFVP